MRLLLIGFFGAVILAPISYAHSQPIPDYYNQPLPGPARPSGDVPANVLSAPTDHRGYYSQNDSIGHYDGNGIYRRQPETPPPMPYRGGDPNNYYSPADQNGYYDRNGRYQSVMLGQTSSPLTSAPLPPSREDALNALRQTVEKNSSSMDFTSHFFDPLTNSDVASPYHASVSDIRIDTQACSLSYRLNKPEQSEVVLISLPAVGSVEVIPIIQVLPPVPLAPGRTLRPIRTDPPYYVVRVYMPGYPQNSLFVVSEVAGQELRTAFMNAVNRCKSGN